MSGEPDPADIGIFARREAARGIAHPAGPDDAGRIVSAHGGG